MASSWNDHHQYIKKLVRNVFICGILKDQVSKDLFRYFNIALLFLIGEEGRKPYFSQHLWIIHVFPSVTYFPKSNSCFSLIIFALMEK